MRASVAFLLIAIVLPLNPSAQTAPADPFVVVVHSDNPISDLTLKTLKRIYLGKITVFPDDSPITLLEYAPLQDKFNEAVLNMSTLKVRKHWMRLVFSGGFATPPQTHNDAEELGKLLSKDKTAIGFLGLSDVEPWMKVLSIDGTHPGEEGYPLK